MLASVEAATLWGVEGQRVVVEVHIGSGLPSFTIVGQPDGACREARDRVRAALLSTGCPWPKTRVTVNLAPADLRKVGASLDLPIAIGILVAMREIPPDRVQGMGFLGELGLDGSVRPFPGTIPLVDVMGTRELVLPQRCAGEALLVHPGRVRGARKLREVVDALHGIVDWPAVERFESGVPELDALDFSDVRGQQMARTAAEIAAAGGHHMLLCGPPGAGKTMIAKRIPAILPALEPWQAIEVVRIHSAAALSVGSTLPVTAPFRSPHHMASAVGLLGGGSAWLRPGELSCAHNGVLFLDEMGEFSPCVLDALRQPLEEGVIRVERARGSAVFPARFMLVGATNPCPCGYLGAEGGPVCQCSVGQRQRYARRLSGPLMDRFDLRVNVERPEPSQLLNADHGESSAAMAMRVAAARSMARERGFACNAQIPDSQLNRYASLNPAARSELERRLRSGMLSARGLARIRRVARTIGDLNGIAIDAAVTPDLVRMAIEFRRPTTVEENQQ